MTNIFTRKHKHKDLLPFTEEHVKNYLDGAIKLWRKRKDEAEDGADLLMAQCYVDAFQSVRITLLGELMK